MGRRSGAGQEMGQVSSMDVAWLVPLLEAKNWGQVKSTGWWLSESVFNGGS